jgi:light-harvesting complex 1 beta chain
MTEKDERIGVRTYLTDGEAREFHKLFMTSFIVFTIVAIIAHFLVWSWRPWLPGPDGYAQAQSSVISANPNGSPNATLQG